MKKFCFKVLIFIIPIVIAIFVLEILLRQIPNDYSYKRNYFDKNSGQMQTLIFGSSHAFYGLDPVYFDTNTFNASHVSQSIFYDCEILKEYEDLLPHLQHVIIPISYPSLFSDLATGVESWRAKSYVIYYGINPTHSLKHSTEIFSQKLTINLKRIYTYYLKHRTEISCSTLGWGTTYMSSKAEDLVKTGKAAAARHTCSNLHDEEITNIFKKNVSNLYRMIDICNQHHVKVILLTTPTYITYRENLNAEQLDMTVNTITEIAAKYPNVTYRNMMSDSTFVDRDFFDADHFSEIGAKKFSLMINQLIEADRQ